MRCSSEAPNDLSFVVYTNSREDYRVTVRSTRACMVGAERLVDKVARDCGEWLTNDFSALVGIVPSPDRPANWLGFRVFDAGQFMDRPHTLAVVAVEVPPDQCRSWKIAQLLAALSPPVPDSSCYELPTEIELQFAAVVDEPFTSLFGWEQRQRNRCEQLVVFSKPANIPLQLNQQVRSSQAQTGKLIARLAVLLCVAFVALTGLLWIFNEGHLPKSPPSSRYSREELVSVLADSGATLLPAVDFEHARIMVVVSANLLNDRLDELAKGLTMRADLPAGDSGQELKRHRQRWVSPIPPGPQAGQQLDDAALDAAIRIHHRYQEAVRLLDRLEKLDPDGDEFARTLTELRNLLANQTRKALSTPRDRND
jgi:hypothetical protein